jgi:Sulfite exporter TauE/SafE
LASGWRIHVGFDLSARGLNDHFCVGHRNRNPCFNLSKVGANLPDTAIRPGGTLGICLDLCLRAIRGLFQRRIRTILTAIYVALFRLSCIEAVVTTKLLNIFSSSVLAGVFIWHGLADYRLGLILGAAMFVGAFIGARWQSG